MLDGEEAQTAADSETDTQPEGQQSGGKRTFACTFAVDQLTSGRASNHDAGAHEAVGEAKQQSQPEERRVARLQHRSQPTVSMSFRLIYRLRYWSSPLAC